MFIHKVNTLTIAEIRDDYMKFSSSQRNPFEADFSISSPKCLPTLQLQQMFQLYFEFVLMKSVEFP